MTASFFTDKTGLFLLIPNTLYVPPGSSSKAKSAATSSLEAATDANRGTQWLILTRPQGVVEVSGLVLRSERDLLLTLGRSGRSRSSL